MHATSAVLKTNGGKTLPILGKIKVMVVTPRSGKAQFLPIVVVMGEGPGLFGRDLISSLVINIGQPSRVNAITSPDVVGKFPSLFAPGRLL